MSIWTNIGGAVLGGIAGAEAPTPGVFDYKKEGVGFLTGYGEDRQKAFAPTLQAMLDQSQGKNLTLSAAERSKLAAGEISRLRANTLTTKRGINNRSIGRGQGQGGGMTEASHLKADIGGLNAERGILGQIAASDIGKRIDRQQNAMGMATNLFGQENQQENAAIGAQWQSKENKNMAGSDAYRAALGAAQGWTAGGPQGGSTQQQGNNPMGPHPDGFRGWRSRNGFYAGDNVGRG